MRILRVDLRRFRGFEAATVLPAGHVVLVGEPGGGRTDLIEGLERVFSPEATRARVPTELDFFRSDKSQRAEVEVVVGDLPETLEQAFLDHLEVWDRERRESVDAFADPEQIDKKKYDFIVRLCYRAVWNENEDHAEHWVDYPKTSDPDEGRFDRVARADRELLPFAVVHGRGRALDLGVRGSFRRLVDLADGGDFQGAMERLGERIEELAGRFSATAQMSASLEQMLSPVRVSLGLEGIPAAEIVRFLPEGGSLTGLMRSLGPAMDLRDGVGFLPLHRHGSTLSGMLGVAQALATVGGGGIVAVDDFGESLDNATTLHLAAMLRRSASQVWLSTRRAGAAEAFTPAELVRLARVEGKRVVYHGRPPKTRRERLVSRQRGLQLLPAVGSRAVIVLEGPHDRAALWTLAIRLFYDEGVPMPAAHGISLIDSGSVDGAGGSTGVARLAQAAREIGLRAISVLDHDGADTQAVAELEENAKAADAVVRLPKGHAIERALVEGLDDEIVRAAMAELEGAFGLTLPKEWNALSGHELRRVVMGALKQAGGLHAQFILALPAKCYPPVAREVLKQAVAVAAKAAAGTLAEKAVVQL